MPKKWILKPARFEMMSMSIKPSPPPRSTLFGRKDLLEVYRRAKDFIIRYKLLRMCRFSDENGLKRLTICNLWRIERKTDGALRLM